MTPVDMTRALEAPADVDAADNAEKAASVVVAMAHASSRPFDPVTAFAQPLFTTTLFARPPVCFSTSLLTWTGAALKTFLVKQAAEEVCDVVETMRARSLGGSVRMDLSFLTPECKPVARKPRGKRSSGITA